MTIAYWTPRSCHGAVSSPSVDRRGVPGESGLWLVFWHYHHRLVVWDLMRGCAVDTLWERATDLRILKSAIASLRAMHE